MGQGDYNILSHYLCPLIIVAFTYKFHAINVPLILGQREYNILLHYLSPIIIFTLAYKFHPINVLLWDRYRMILLHYLKSHNNCYI